MSGGRSGSPSSSCRRLDGSDRRVPRDPPDGAGRLPQYAPGLPARPRRAVRIPASGAVCHRERESRGLDEVPRPPAAARTRQPERRPAPVGRARPLSSSPRRGRDRARSDRAPGHSSAPATSPPDLVDARRGGAHRSARRQPPGRASRPDAPRAAVRLGPASVRGARPAHRGRESVGRLRRADRQGQPPTSGPGGRAGAPVGASLPQDRAPIAGEAHRSGDALPEPVRARVVAPGAVGAPQDSAPGAPICALPSRPIRCATASRVIFSSAAPISGPCRRCWATPTSPRRRSTRICRRARSATCTCAFILARGRRAE